MTKALNPKHIVPFDVKREVVDSILKSEAFEEKERYCVELDAANDSIFVLDTKTGAKYKAFFSVLIRGNNLYAELQDAFHNIFVLDFLKDVARPDKEHFFVMTGEDSDSRYYNLNTPIEERFKYFQQRIREKYKYPDDFHKVTYQTLFVLFVCINPDDVLSPENLNTVFEVTWYYDNGNDTVTKIRVNEASIGYADILNNRSPFNIALKLFNIETRLKYLFKCLVLGRISYMPLNVYEKLLHPSTKSFHCIKILDNYSIKVQNEFAKRSIVYLKQQGLDTKTLHSEFFKNVRENYSKLYGFINICSKTDKYEEIEIRQMTSYFLYKLYRNNRKLFHQVIREGLSNELKRELLFLGFFIKHSYIEFDCNRILLDNNLYERFLSIQKGEIPSTFVIENPKAFFKRINNRKRFGRYLQAVSRRYYRQISKCRSENIGYRDIDIGKIYTDEAEYDRLKLFNQIHCEMSDLLIKYTQPGDDYKIEYIIKMISDIDLNLIGDKIKSPITSYTCDLVLKTPEKGIRSAVKQLRRANRSLCHVRHVTAHIHVSNQIQDALRIISGWEETYLIEYGLEDEVKSLIAEYKNHKWRSIKSLLKWALKVHDFEKTVNKIKQKQGIKNFPMYPLPEVLAALQPYWMRTTAEMVDAGIELEHCIGSYAPHYNVPQWFFRKDTVAAQLKWNRTLKRIEVKQCYDYRNSVTKDSQMFNKHLEQVVKLANQQLQNNPDLVDFPILDKRTIRPLDRQETVAITA